MAKAVVLHHLNQLFFGCFLANDGLELHGCKYKQSPLYLPEGAKGEDIIMEDYAK